MQRWWPRILTPLLILPYFDPLPSSCAIHVDTAEWGGEVSCPELSRRQPHLLCVEQRWTEVLCRGNKRTVPGVCKYQNIKTLCSVSLNGGSKKPHPLCLSS